jgi:hypothetical protein
MAPGTCESGYEKGAQMIRTGGNKLQLTPSLGGLIPDEHGMNAAQISILVLDGERNCSQKGSKIPCVEQV